jgi:hypothetical protein
LPAWIVLAFNQQEGMPMRIDISPDQFVVLSRSRTEPETQSHAVRAWLAASSGWLDVTGFAAGGVLRSLDGARVVAYGNSPSRRHPGTSPTTACRR